MSSSSPAGSHTSTSLHESSQHKKDIFEIWRAHKPPYMATVSSHDPVDMAEKVHRALGIKGPKLFLSLAVCPTGWGFDHGLGDEIAKRAIESGVWPLKEAVRGEVRHTYMPNKFHPVAEYLEPQRRFRRLFKPERNDAALAQIQSNVDAYWKDIDPNVEKHKVLN